MAETFARRQRLAALLLTIPVVVAACSGGGEDRGEALEGVAAQIIVPAYETFASDVTALDAAAAGFCADPTPEGIRTVGAAAAAAHASWAFTESMWIGPVMDRRSWAVIDWPIAAVEIDTLLADTTIELDVERIGQRIGADQRGLGAVEHLLDADRSAFDDPRRCDYLVSITEVIDVEAALILADWTVGSEGVGPWMSLIGDDGDANMDALVNDAVFMLEASADAELGTALGEMDREQNLEAIVEGPLGLGVEELRGRMAGLRAVFVGTPEAPGLNGLFGDDLATRLGAQIDAADDALAAVDGPLGVAVVERPADVSAARTAIKAVQITVSTEVVSRLGVTIGFSDADGDTGG